MHDTLDANGLKEDIDRLLEVVDGAFGRLSGPVQATREFRQIDAELSRLGLEVVQLVLKRLRSGVV